MLALVLLFLMLFVAVVLTRSVGRPAPPPAGSGGEEGEEGWAYGDVWKQGYPEETAPGKVPFVEILRGDTGRGYDDTVMMDLVGYLGSVGIRATYDSFSLGLEPAAIKTYVLKVEEGKIEEARERLGEKFK